MKPVIIIAISVVLLSTSIPIDAFLSVNENKSKWTDNLFDWHEQGLVSSNEFIAALGYLSDNKIMDIHLGKVYTDKIPGDRNIATTDSSFDYNHPAFKNNQQGNSYVYSGHDQTIFKYIHSNGIEYKIVKQYDGTLLGYLGGKYISSYSSCYWC